MWVVYQDVINRWIGVGDDVFPISQSVTETLIEDSEALILNEFPLLNDDVVSGLLNVVLIKQVVARMINSYIISGNGLSQHSQTTGPYTDSRSYSTKTTRPHLVLTDEDKAQLNKKIKNQMGSLETIHYYRHRFQQGEQYQVLDWQDGWSNYGSSSWQ